MNQIGHNKPPTPFEVASEEIDSLYEEATNWADGEPVQDQGVADSIGDLIEMITKARKEADAARKLENKPFDEGKKEVQARYNPILKKADTAKDACKQALAPWLEHLDEQQRYAEAEARRVAEEKRHEAEEAIHTKNMADLAEREKAEAAIQSAKSADIELKQAEKARPTAGKAGRSVHLRTVWTPYMTDPTEAARHYWQTRPEDIKAFLFRLAQEDVRAGKRLIPGFEIMEERKAV